MKKICYLIYLIMLISSQENKKIKFVPPKEQSTGPLSLEFLRNIKEVFHSDIFIETGTYAGNTTLNASKLFDNVFTVELDNNLFDTCNKKFEDNKNIHTFKGDSEKILRKLLPILKEKKLIIYLDAHFSGGQTAYGLEVCPILRELRAIKDSDIKDAVILIDDLRCFQPKRISKSYAKINPSDWKINNFCSFKMLKQAVLSINYKNNFLVYGDIALVYLDEYNVEPEDIIKAMTFSKEYDFIKNASQFNSQVIIDYEKIIKNAGGIAVQAISELIFQPPLYCTHYKLWHALTLINARKFEAAKALLEEILNLGFKHERIYTYLKEAELNIAEEKITRLKSVINKSKLTTKYEMVNSEKIMKKNLAQPKNPFFTYLKLCTNLNKYMEDLCKNIYLQPPLG